MKFFSLQQWKQPICCKSRLFYGNLEKFQSIEKKSVYFAKLKHLSQNNLEHYQNLKETRRHEKSQQWLHVNKFLRHLDFLGFQLILYGL